MQVLTSLSGIQFSAASAGFAPTNSADVSAIASAYQVVSSTSTQLHAGTAYLTGVNGAPISASRAGQAANASLSNSAYYDGTGRLISALPDSAAVSAIASSYAESAASGKQDTIEFGYDANNLISSIDGSALAGQGGGGGGSVESPFGTIIVIDGTAIEGTNSAIGIVPEFEKFLNLAPSSPQINYWYSNVLMGGQSASGASLMRLTALEYTSNPERVFTVSISGNPIGGGSEIVGTATASSYGSSMEFEFPLDPSWGFGTIWASANPSTISLNTADDKALAFYSATTALGVKELAWKDELPTYQYDGSGKISAINGSALGGMDEAAVSGIASAYAESAASGKLDATAFNSGDFYSTGNPSGFVDSKFVESSVSGFVDSAYVDSAVSGKMDSSASSSFYTTANESGFVDSAYVDSAVSGKMDISGMSSYATTAYVESGLSGKENVFSAGDGLEFTTDGQGNRVLQVEAPVDIVAGPGIVIDNPDGNTLRVSQQYPTDETVLSNTTYLMSNNPTIILSEPAWNFEFVDIYALPHSTNSLPIVLRFKTGGLVGGDAGSITVQAHAGGGGIRLNNGLLSITGSGNLMITETKQFSIIGTTVSQANAASSFVKVVGVHRIANN